MWSQNLVKLKRYKILTTFRELNWILHSIFSCPKILVKLVWDKTGMTLIVDQGKVFINSQAIRFSNPIRILVKGCVRVIRVVAVKNNFILRCNSRVESWKFLQFYCNDPIWHVFRFPGKKNQSHFSELFLGNFESAYDMLVFYGKKALPWSGIRIQFDHFHFHGINRGELFWGSFVSRNWPAVISRKKSIWFHLQVILFGNLNTH